MNLKKQIMGAHYQPMRHNMEIQLQSIKLSWHSFHNALYHHDTFMALSLLDALKIITPNNYHHIINIYRACIWYCGSVWECLFGSAFNLSPSWRSHKLFLECLFVLIYFLEKLIRSFFKSQPLAGSKGQSPWLGSSWKFCISVSDALE